MIRLKRVVLRNFGSWKSLDFPLADQGLVLLTGKTGSGKSTIFRAIYWCLFGKTPEGHRVSDLCRYGTNSCSVRVEFSKQSENYSELFLDYMVTRYRNHPVWKNKVRVIGAGVPKIDEDSLREDSDPLIEHILGFGPEVFSKVFYFVQRDTKRFSTMTDSERKTFLESMTYGALLQQCERSARKRVRDIQQSIDLIDERLHARVETLDLVRKQSEEVENLLKSQLENLKLKEKKARALYDTFRRRHEDHIGKWYTFSSGLQSKINFYEQVRASLKRIGDTCPVCASVVNKLLRRQRYKSMGVSLKEAVEKREVYERRINRYEVLKEAIVDVELEQARVRGRSQSKIIESNVSTQLQERTVQDEGQQLDLRDQLMYNEYWIKGFSTVGLRSYMVGNVVKQMTRYIDGYLTMIDPSLKASFLVKDNRVLFLGEDSRSLATFSGGERQAIDLAVGLGLRNLLEASTETLDSLILDEPFEGLDSNLQVSCQRILYALPKKSVFFVTHTGFLAKFAKEYEVSKLDGVSSLYVVREQVYDGV